MKQHSSKKQDSRQYPPNPNQNYNTKHKEQKVEKHPFQSTIKASNTQASFNLLVLKKMEYLIKEYFRLIPQIENSQSQIITLVQCNQKLYDILLKFEDQEHLLISRLGKLEEIHIETYNQYCRLTGRESIKPKKNVPERIFDKFQLKQLQYQLPHQLKSLQHFDYRGEIIKILRDNFIVELSGIEQKIVKELGQSEKTDKLEIMLQNIQKYNKGVIQMEESEELFFEFFQLKATIYKQLEQYEGLKQEKLCIIQNQDNLVTEIFQLHTKIDKLDQKTLLNCLQQEKGVRQKSVNQVKKTNKLLMIEYQRMEEELKLMKDKYEIIYNKYKQKQKQLSQLKLNISIQSRKHKNSAINQSRKKQQMSDSLHKPDKSICSQVNNWAEIQCLKKQIQSLNTQLIKINKQLNQAKINQNQLAQQVKIQKQQKQQLSIKMMEYQSYITSQQCTLKQVEENNQKKMQKYEEEIKQLKTKTQQMKEQIKRLQQKKGNVLQGQKQLVIEVKEQQVRSPTKQKHYIRQYQSKIVKQDNHSSYYEHEIAERDKKIQQLVSSNQQLVTINHNYQQQKQVCMQKLDDLQHYKEQLQSINQQYTNAIKVKEHLEQKHSQLIQQYESLVQEKKSAQEIMGDILFGVKGNRLFNVEMPQKDEGLLGSVCKIKKIIDQMMKSPLESSSIPISKIKLKENYDSHGMGDSIYKSFHVIGSQQIKSASKSNEDLASEIQECSKDYWQLYKRYQQAAECLSREQQKNIQNELKYQKFVEEVLNEYEGIDQEHTKQALHQQIFYLKRLAREQKQTIDSERVGYNQTFKDYHEAFKREFDLELNQYKNQQLSMKSEKMKRRMLESGSYDHSI